MPAKPKAAVKANQPETKATSPAPAATTVSDRSHQRYFGTNPLQQKVDTDGFQSLTPAEKKTYAHTNLILPVFQQRVPLSNKTEREFWKQVNKESLPIRRLRDDYDWGKDKSGQDIGTYQLGDLEKRSTKQAQLAALRLLHQHFVTKRQLAQQKGTELTEKDIQEEKQRRRDMAGLRKDLYGQILGPLASDPEWDDVIPIPNDEPEDALAKIAYPDDYAEAISYLRAVMAAEEYSPRCLRLTDLVIDMNASHYTVWLYRFKIIKNLQLPVPDEIKWLNEVALNNLKNYQIWHHRQLLLDYFYPILTVDPANAAAATTEFARTEREFIATMLAEDSKNYHVWSYRLSMVKKLNQFSTAEFASTQNFIEEDVRNNSAWSHRFFLTCSNPEHSTPGSTPAEHDPKIPDSIIDKEIKYAQEKILLAPQNQSPWNYMQALITKSGRKLNTLQAFVQQFVDNVGKDDEAVRSSHALNLLADIYEEEGDKSNATVCLQSLAKKWDPVREGYWKFRLSELA